MSKLSGMKSNRRTLAVACRIRQCRKEMKTLICPRRPYNITKVLYTSGKKLIIKTGPKSSTIVMFIRKELAPRILIKLKSNQSSHRKLRIVIKPTCLCQMLITHWKISKPKHQSINLVLEKCFGSASMGSRH